MTEEPEKRVCKRGHPNIRGKDCQVCRKILKQEYRRDHPEYKAKSFLPIEEEERIRARARITASKAMELLESRLPKPPPPKDTGLYHPTGMGYSVRRNYP